MALTDRFKSKKSDLVQNTAAVDSYVVTLTDPVDTESAFSIPANPVQPTSQTVTLNIAPVQTDQFNIQAGIDNATLLETNVERKLAIRNARLGIPTEIVAPVGDMPLQQGGSVGSVSPGTSLPASVDELLRNYTSDQLSAYIDASRIETVQKTTTTTNYPRISLTEPLPEFVIPGNVLVDGQSPSAATPADSPVLESPIYRVAYPRIIATDAYLNDPIQFQTDRRLYRNTVTTEIPSGSLPSYMRDIATFVTVPLGTYTRGYSIATTNGVSNRTAEGRYIHSNFEEF